MLEIGVDATVDAAHRLRDYPGSCQRLHGHTYRVRATFRIRSLEDSGMAMDFSKAKEILRTALDYMDHQYINELPEFSLQNPTAENIARFIFEQLKEQNVQLHSVSVWETATSRATYFEEE